MMGQKAVKPERHIIMFTLDREKVIDFLTVDLVLLLVIDMTTHCTILEQACRLYSCRFLACKYLTDLKRLVAYRQINIRL